MSELRFRPAAPDDIIPFQQLVRQGMLDTYVNPDKPNGVQPADLDEQYFTDEISSRRYAEQLETADDAAAWVATDDGKLVGAITTRVHEDGGVEIQKLYVDGAVRGQGLGLRLLGLAYSYWGNDRSYWLDVLHYNHGAIKFYQKHGFAIDETAGKIRYDYLPKEHWPAAHRKGFWSVRMVRPAGYVAEGVEHNGG